MTQRRSRILLGLVVLVVLAASIVLTNVFPFRQILAQQSQVEQVREQLAVITAENDRLEGEAEALLTDAEVERLARESLGYVRPGEIAYVVVESPETIPPPEPVVPEDQELGSDRAWYEKVWDFLSGRDLLDEPA